MRRQSGTCLVCCPHDFIDSILFSVANRNAEELFKVVERMFERSINIESALDDLLLKLHDLGLHKVTPSLVESRTDNVEQLRELAAVMTEEEIQLYYQIGLLGKRDLKLAPTARIGLENDFASNDCVSSRLSARC